MSENKGSTSTASVPPYKKWWFWVIIGVVVLATVATIAMVALTGKMLDDNRSSSGGSSSSLSTTPDNASSTNWKQFLKDYEKWVDSYISVYNKYKANPSDPSLLSDYTALAAKASEWASKASEIQDDLSGSDLTEYTKTMNRIMQKISNAIK